MAGLSYHIDPQSLGVTIPITPWRSNPILDVLNTDLKSVHSLSILHRAHPALPQSYRILYHISSPHT
jgi:hypothetical protein